jgi:hypothetical protein
MVGFCEHLFYKTREIFLTSCASRTVSRKFLFHGACSIHLKKKIRMTFFLRWAERSLSKWLSRRGMWSAEGGDTDDAVHYLRSSTGRTSYILWSLRIHLLLGLSTGGAWGSGISSCNLVGSGHVKLQFYYLLQRAARSVGGIHSWRLIGDLNLLPGYRDGRKREKN